MVMNPKQLGAGRNGPEVHEPEQVYKPESQVVSNDVGRQALVDSVEVALDPYAERAELLAQQYNDALKGGKPFTQRFFLPVNTVTVGSEHRLHSAFIKELGVELDETPQIEHGEDGVTEWLEVRNGRVAYRTVVQDDDGNRIAYYATMSINEALKNREKPTGNGTGTLYS